ncbi:hypothetical protein [Anaeromyxobacter oryzisoli]|uniref:hypothetical protein n=1 Tax=Anaeromyxobacter oryzisoli TaxID=2925408 RepID=UPI001F5A4C09|nr:hypothetical protein [Anaeromyxobacter sp. SG63]
MRLSLVTLVLLSAACAAPHPWSGAALCELDRPQPAAPQSAGEDGEPGVRPAPPPAPVVEAEPGTTQWLQLMLRGWDAETGRATAPAVDCTGRQIRWEAPALACDDPAVARALLPDHPLGEADVVVAPLPEGERLVWIVTNRLASGEGLGPVAVVTVQQRRLVVRAIGTLRANVVRPKLRLERLGTTEALVAEGESCARADPATCVRAARVMPLVGGRFSPAALVNAAGVCAGPAWFYLGREEAERLPSGWKRRTRLDGSLSFGAEGFSVDEQVVVHDLDPRQPNAPPRLFRKAESRLTVKLAEGRLVTSGPSLWVRMHSKD